MLSSGKGAKETDCLDLGIANHDLLDCPRDVVSVLATLFGRRLNVLARPICGVIWHLICSNHWTGGQHASSRDLTRPGETELRAYCLAASTRPSFAYSTQSRHSYLLGVLSVANSFRRAKSPRGRLLVSPLSARTGTAGFLFASRRETSFNPPIHAPSGGRLGVHELGELDVKIRAPRGFLGVTIRPRRSDRWGRQCDRQSERHCSKTRPRNYGHRRRRKSCQIQKERLDDLSQT